MADPVSIARRRVAIVALVVVVAAGALVLWPTRGRQSPPAAMAAGERQAPAPSASIGAGVASPAAPARADAASTPSRSHDAAGARAAALSLVEFNERLVGMDEGPALDARRAMAASGAADALVEQLRSKLAELRQGWPKGTLTYWVAPLATRVTGGGDAFTAEVWYVGVVAARGVPTYEEWNTETYRLVWERDDWRMASLATSAGPRPDPSRQAVATSAELEARLVGFGSL